MDTVVTIVLPGGRVNLHQTPLHVLKGQQVRTVEWVTMSAIWVHQAFLAQLPTVVIPSAEVAMPTVIV